MFLILTFHIKIATLLNIDAVSVMTLVSPVRFIQICSVKRFGILHRILIWLRTFIYRSSCRISLSLV